MEFNERYAQRIVDVMEGRDRVGIRHPTLFADRRKDIPFGLFPISKGNWKRTHYRRRLMKSLGIPISRRWLRRQ